MNYLKNEQRSRLTDESLQSQMKLKVLSYQANVDVLCSEIQGQISQYLNGINDYLKVLCLIVKFRLLKL